MKIGLLLYTYTDSSEREKFGIDTFLRRGLDVSVIDCRSYFFSQQNEHKSINSFHTFIKNAEELSLALNTNQFDYLLVNFPFTFKSFPLYRSLWKSGIPFGAFVLDSWPHGLSFFFFARFKRFIKNIVLFLLMSFYPKIEKIFVPVSYYPETQYMIWRSRHVLAFRSFDFDYFVFEDEISPKSNLFQNSIVFLDQYWPFHPDFYAVDKQLPLQEKEYKESLEILFKAVENKTGLKVVIALHPKANVDNSKKIYSDRTCVQGNTYQLISQAKIVLGHYSTSFIFALVKNKPLGLISFKALSKKHQFYMENLVGHFHFPILFADNFTHAELDQFLINTQKVDGQNLIQKYVAYDTKTQKRYWDFLIENFFS